MSLMMRWSTGKVAIPLFSIEPAACSFREYNIMIFYFVCRSNSVYITKSSSWTGATLAPLADELRRLDWLTDTLLTACKP